MREWTFCRMMEPVSFLWIRVHMMKVRTTDDRTEVVQVKAKVQ